MEYSGGALHRYTKLSVASIVVDLRVTLRVIDVDDDVTFDYSICGDRLSRTQIWNQMTIRLSVDFAASAPRGSYALWNVGIGAC